VSEEAGGADAEVDGGADPVAAEAEHRLALQEEEYRLPHHWVLRKHGLANYLHKSDRLADLVRAAGCTGGAALDVGCGDGRGTHELASRLGPAFTWTGVDFSERAIAFARLMAEDLHFEVQDGERLAAADGAYDLVVAREVIEHVPPPDVGSFVAELRRVLRPGGVLVVTTPTTNRRVPEKHFQHFTEASLRTAIEGGGDFRVERVEGLGWFPGGGRLERAYRYVIALPALWRLDAWNGSRALPPAKADDLLVVARAVARP